MRLKNILTISLLSINSINVNAQNIPDGSDVSSNGSLTGKIGRPKNFNQSPNTAPTIFNYDRVYVPLEPMTTVPSFENTKFLPITVNTSYLNGRHESTLEINRNGASKDIAVVKDNRVSLTKLSYLPFAMPYHSRWSHTSYSDQAGYYMTQYPQEDSTAYNVVKAWSSQGRPVITNYNAGYSFVGRNKGTMTQSGVCLSSDNIYILSYSGGSICKSGTYTEGALWKQETIGQHSQVSETYTNKANQLVCKKVYVGGSAGNGGWLSTYYIYNDFGKLTHVIPPKASEQFNSNTCLTDVEKLCFTYQYNEHGFIVSKGTPGMDGTDDIIYDLYGNAMLTRSPQQKSRDEWSFAIYDHLDRVAFSGIYTGTETMQYFQDIVRGTTSPVNHGVSANQTLEYWLTHKYTGNSHPTSLFGCDIRAYNYYDDYSVSPANSFSFNNNYAPLYLTGASMENPEPYMNGYGKLVASKTKIIDNGVPNSFVNQWITTAYFYDEKGRTIQTQTINPWNTTRKDINTTQYNFSGNVVLNISKYNAWLKANVDTLLVLTKSNYDSRSGQLTGVQKKINGSMWYDITTLTYDDLGNVKTKSMGDGAEVQNYTYNIRGQLIGINEADLYTTSSALNNKTYLSSISYDAGFDSKRFDGAISGYIWRTPSTPQMAYGYSYDNAARMTHAEFSELTGSGPTWNKTNADYTVSNITYDANGNMLTMNQKGINSSSGYSDIDVLSYSYDAGNQLTKVTDAGVASPIMDFDNGASGTSTDYRYDKNGNLEADLNKAIDSIIYNHQDLPLRVRKGTDNIYNIYDASGTLLQKTINDNGVVDTFIYWGGLVFKDDSLQYVLHEEGRARWLPDSNFFKFDFNVKDHLGNVRTTVTADVSYGTVSHTATFEVAYANVEEAIFDNVVNVSDLSPSGTPGDVQAGHLNGGIDSLRIGAAILQHVMAGDQLNLQAYGYYEAMDSTTLSTYALPEDMASRLLTSLLGSPNTNFNEGVGTPINGDVISNLISPSNYDMYELIKNDITDPAYPRAYLNYLVFDEMMQLQPEECIVVQLKGTPSSWNGMSIPGSAKVKSNGYILVYLSNETPGDVYVNNAHILNIKGRLLEEKIYYPHGLLLDLGSNTSLSLKNQYLYQGKRLQPELGLELYDFHARQYDPQVGRFWGIDPLDQFPSGYTGMGNDPANNIDPSGMWALSENRMGGDVTGVFEYNRKENEAKEQMYMLELTQPRVSVRAEFASRLNAMMWGEPEMPEEMDESLVDEMFREEIAEGNGNDEDPMSVVNRTEKMEETYTPEEQELRDKARELAKEEIPEDLKEFYSSSCKGCSAEGPNDGDGDKSGGKETQSMLTRSWPIALTSAAADGPVPVGEIIGTAVVAGAIVHDLTQKKYITYTLSNPTTGQTYVGRTSGFGDPNAIVKNRFNSHHMKALGFGSPKIDKVAQGYPIGYYAIRGREQDLVNGFGGIGSRSLGNRINPISPYNPLRSVYLSTSQLMFGTYGK